MRFFGLLAIRFHLVAARFQTFAARVLPGRLIDLQGDERLGADVLEYSSRVRPTFHAG